MAVLQKRRKDGLTSITYAGSGRVIKASYDGAGRVKYVSGTLNSAGTNYARGKQGRDVSLR